MFEWDVLCSVGDLYNEEELLNWLIEFQDLGEALEAIEDVSPNALAHLVDETPYLAVLFCKLIGDFIFY